MFATPGGSRRPKKPGQLESRSAIFGHRVLATHLGNGIGHLLAVVMLNLVKAKTEDGRDPVLAVVGLRWTAIGLDDRRLDSMDGHTRH